MVKEDKKTEKPIEQDNHNPLNDIEDSGIRQIVERSVRDYLTNNPQIIKKVMQDILNKKNNSS